MPPRIDGLQYARYDRSVFEEMRAGGLDAAHVTIAYHETFREMVLNLEAWNQHFETHGDLILRGTSAADIDEARASERTAIFFGFQNPSPIEDDLGLIEICHQLGVRFMQLSYNNQSLLATGAYEAEDPGLTRFGKQAVAEMNRVGLVIDMSHSADRSTREAIDLSARPIAITHANPHWWHPALRNFKHEVLAALTARGGMLGFSLYPHHLRDGSACTLESFCAMIADCADRYGSKFLGIGSDLCQHQPDAIVTWMRNGRWAKATSPDYGEGSAQAPGFPPMPSWYQGNQDFPALERGLRSVGFARADIDAILGGNWYRFYAENFGPSHA